LSSPKSARPERRKKPTASIKVRTHRTEWRPLPVDTGPNHIFAIGDIHGEIRTLRASLKVISCLPKEGASSEVVFLGDLIDRGDASIKCLNLAMHGAAEAAGVDRRILLPGNHEIGMLHARKDHLITEMWRQSDGRATMMEMGNPSDLGDALEERLGPQYAEIILHRSHYRAGGLLFVHAGIHPSAPIEEFLAEDAYGGRHDFHWAWIRKPFLESRGPWTPEDDLVVVHGHSNTRSDPASSAYLSEAPWSVVGTDECDMVETCRRINLDVACGKGRTTAAVAEFLYSRYRIHIVEVG
jgi:serine/threonine protein phosphatase 1